MTRPDSRLLIVMLAAIILIAVSNLAVTILHYTRAQPAPARLPGHSLSDTPQQTARTEESTSPAVLNAIEHASERLTTTLEETEAELAEVPLGNSSVTLFDVMSLMKDSDGVSGDTDTASDELILTAEQRDQILAAVDSLVKWKTLNESSQRECAEDVAESWILMLTQAIDAESMLDELQNDETRHRMLLMFKLMSLAETGHDASVGAADTE
jgi:hypothetical protein